MYTFYAKVNKVFVKSLQNELKQLGIEPESMLNLNKEGLNYLKFKSEFKSIWKIMLYSRLIEGLKIQIASGINAFDEKSLKTDLKNVDFEKYLPLENSLEFKMPIVKAYSYRSKLYHEKMIENIIRTSLNKIAYNFNTSQNESTKLKFSESNEEIVEKLEKRKNLKEIPRIDIIIQRDKARILLNLLNKPLHMHGYKNTINWGSLRETLASAIIYKSDIINKFAEEKTLFLWDPFCGCGTIPIEAFLLVTERHIRPIEDIKSEAFTNMPFHNKKEFDEFLKEEKPESQQENIVFRDERTDLYIIGSDISSKSIDAFSKNSIKAQLNKYMVKSLDVILYEAIKMNTKINPNIYHSKINNVLSIFIGDFENISKEVIFNQKLPFHDKKFTIMSNVPYGTSQEMADKVQIKSLYKRFGKFLRKYSDFFEDVFILVNKRNPKDELNFKNLTEIDWEIVNTFINGGIDVELLKMKK